MINTPQEKAKKLIKEAIKKKEIPITIKAQNDEFNRKIIEYGKFDILLGLEESNKTDKLKQANSGLNHIMAKLAAKNKISIGINIEQLRKLNKERRAITLSRIIQNIKTCRKAKTKIKLLNYKDKNNAFYLLISWGASTQQAKEAIEN